MIVRGLHDEVGDEAVSCKTSSFTSVVWTADSGVGQPEISEAHVTAHLLSHQSPRLVIQPGLRLEGSETRCSLSALPPLHLESWSGSPISGRGPSWKLEPLGVMDASKRVTVFTRKPQCNFLGTERRYRQPTDSLQLGQRTRNTEKLTQKGKKEKGEVSG